MSKILCPVDFGESSLNATTYAANLAEQLGAQLVLLHVEPKYMMVLKEGDDNAGIKGESEMRLQAIANDLQTKHNIDCTFQFDFADLLTGIKEVTSDSDYGLIVMGTDGVSDIHEYHMGSNTAQVASNTRCSLLSIPEEIAYKKPKHIFFAVDNPGEGHQKMLEVITFARTFDADITILHVDQPGDGRHIDETFKKELLGSLDFPNWISFSELKSGGSISNQLADYLRTHEDSILVSMTHDLSDYKSVFHQSVTKDLLEDALYPVLVFHA